MGKMKEKWQQLQGEAGNLSTHLVNTAVEQEISVGDAVNVYDTSSLLAPRQGVVLYKKNVAGHSLVDVDLDSNGLIQVYEIQCMKIKKRLPRVLWLKYDVEQSKYDVAIKNPGREPGWAKFKEEV
jgi:hypothetical protein